MEDSKMTLEEIQAALDEEAELWDENEIGINMTTHSNESIFVLKQQVQTMMNILLQSGIVSEEELNIEFKTLMLNSMRELREAFVPSRRAKIHSLIKPGIALPEHKLLGPNGEDLKKL